MILFQAGVIAPTRRLLVEVGGIDPAAMGWGHGLSLVVQAAHPEADVVRFRPDWSATRPVFAVVWVMQFRLASLLHSIWRQTRM